ncbi:MAG TPA: PIN domain-containing protein, partial [Candidatus Polarisedimenticolia bacterium]|nr:PIN domain-containing protein [Candidatus Polarisedimenticolia bacterium]
MMQWILRVFFTVFALVLSLQLFPLSPSAPDFRFLPVAALLIAAGLALEAAARGVEVRVLTGALVGLVAGAAAGTAFWRLVPDAGVPGVGPEFLRPAILLVCLYLGGALGARKAESFSWEAFHSTGTRNSPSLSSKILDTSVIIDGRIADVCETGFLDGALLVPQFVLNELQYIADSADPLKRNRGRKGLDILQRIQKGVHVKVVITAADFPEVRDVDMKLIELAKQTGSKILTNDFNL